MARASSILSSVRMVSLRSTSLRGFFLIPVR
jgi:hypothetical protein